MDDINLYLPLVSVAEVILVTIAGVAVWRQKTKLSYCWFFLGAVVGGGAQIKFAIALSIRSSVDEFKDIYQFVFQQWQFFSTVFRFSVGASPNFVAQISNKSLNQR